MPDNLYMKNKWQFNSLVWGFFMVSPIREIPLLNSRLSQQDKAVDVIHWLLTTNKKVVKMMRGRGGEGRGSIFFGELTVIAANYMSRFFFPRTSDTD